MNSHSEVVKGEDQAKNDNYFREHFKLIKSFFSKKPSNLSTSDRSRSVIDSLTSCLAKIVRQRTKPKVNSDLDHKILNLDWIAVINSFAINTKRFIKTNKMISITIALTLLSENVESHPGPIQAPSFSVVTFNCNGLGDKVKLKRLLVKLNLLVNKGCFVLLQETHIIDSEYLKLIWKHKFVSNGYRSNSAGIITLFNNKYDLKYEESDGEGRRSIIALEDGESKFIIANSYFPNDHRSAIDKAEELYMKILETKFKFDEHIIISGGDFNVCLTEHDQLNRKIASQEKELAFVVSENNKVLGLKDSFRTIHPKAGFTWKRGLIYSRLDYVFVSTEIVACIKCAKVDWAFESSDHAAVILNFKLENEQVRGPGLTKVNVKLLNNKESKKNIEHELEEAMKQADVGWNPHLKLEFLKVMIRSIFALETNKSRSRIKTDLEDREITMNQMQNMKIAFIQNNPKNEMNDDKVSKYTSIENSIEFLKNEISSLRKKLSDTMAFSSKANWYDKGEKSNKFFLNLHSLKRSQKLITNIKDGNKEFKGHAEVTLGIRSFYEDLYKKNININNSENGSFYDECPKLSDSNREHMEKEISLKELYDALVSCKPSAPGPDGIPYEIYKSFWRIIGPVVLDSWKYSIEVGTLPPSHLESSIVLLPKEGKDCGDVKNWRPITLSNCDLKIVTKALSSKMANVLDQIIVNSQTAYVPGRSVSDNLRSNFFLKQHCKSNKQNAVLISLDAKKAFDSVDHQYIEETLRAYGFGPNLINTFRVLYNNITARILVNGFQSEAIKIERGVKQGDALSCAIFIICIDPLIRNINKNKKIIPVKIGGIMRRIYFKAAAYADDISVICLNTVESIQNVFSEYNKLSQLSGLELNADKTEILKLYEEGQSEIEFSYGNQNHKISTVNKIKICGLYYCREQEEEYKLNVKDKIEKVEIQIKKWSRNHLTMEGKILIVKTFGLSQVIYNMQVHEFKEKEIVYLERLVFGFLWGNAENFRGIDRIKRSILKNEFIYGGLNVTDVECLDRSLKTRQFFRASITNHPISDIQKLLSCSVSNDKQIRQEYHKISNKEAICSRAHNSINHVTDYNRANYNLRTCEETEIANTVNEIASIRIRDFLTRKKLLLHLCLFKPLEEIGITTLGELYQEYEFEQDVATNRRMKGILNAFPNNLVEFLGRMNEDTNSNEEVKNIKISDLIRKEYVKITTKELQKLLKSVLNKIENADFIKKLGVETFNNQNIADFRGKCKNVKLRNIYFRLIHNDFFSREKMKKFKMIECDKCLRCGRIESSKHLVWECPEVQIIWSLYNSFIGKIDPANDKVRTYENIFECANSTFFATFKMKIIQELIQIERPRDWSINTFKGIALEQISIEKYNSHKTIPLLLRIEDTIKTL